MAEEYVPRGEFNEYKEKIDAENHRQNQRLNAMDESIKENSALTVSVQKLATNMESMLKEQEKQGQRLDSLEARDGEKWRTVSSYIITAVIGLVLGLLCTQLGV